MKLVEIDDNTTSTCNNTRTDDENYTKPFVLSTLDNIMNEILRTPISDSDKWRLYSQALHKYLNHVKITTRNVPHEQTYLDKEISQKQSYPSSYPDSNWSENNSVNESFNFSLPAQLEMSGVEPIRDSLDSISQPGVRRFFENIRVSNSNNHQSNRSPILPIENRQSMSSSTQSSHILSTDEDIRQIERRVKKTGINRRSRPYETRTNAVRAKKRRAENSLSAELSRMRPCKVTLTRSRYNNWEPTNAR